ncbi:uncharacterized protein ACNLHF_007110 [Anomaloglossus baeobatrachus]
MFLQLMDHKGYNHLVDSFSFGVILYLMSVGDQLIAILQNSMYLVQWAITSSIRSHLFFYSINWSDVESGRAEPPFP